MTSPEYGGIDPIGITLEVWSTDLLLLLVEHPGQGTAFADGCSGLLMPSAGEIRFLSRSWPRLKPDTANALRGHIGRVFSEGSWIHSLTLIENTLLQQLHHTRLPLEHHLGEASRIARRFGLPGIPAGFPEEFSPADLQRASWVRAFLGQPVLILLEEPTRNLTRDTLSGLINVIRKARDDGAAVIWITADPHLWQEDSIPATRRFRWLGRNLMEAPQR